MLLKILRYVMPIIAVAAIVAVAVMAWIVPIPTNEDTSKATAKQHAEYEQQLKSNAIFLENAKRDLEILNAESDLRMLEDEELDEKILSLEEQYGIDHDELYREYPHLKD